MHQSRTASFSGGLDSNGFYNWLLDHKVQYITQTLTNGSILCIPHTPRLNSHSFSSTFIDQHIAKPSPFYRGEYNTVWKNSNNVPFKLWIDDDARTIRTSKDRDISIDILYHESAYLKKNKYEVYLISRPLFTDEEFYQACTTEESDLLTNTTLNGVTQYIDRFGATKKIRAKLDSEIRTFKAKYIVLPGFLSDASMKIDTTVNRILNGNRSEHLAVACHRVGEMRAVKIVPYMSHNGFHCVQISGLSYVHDHVYDHLMPVIEEYYEPQNEEFSKQCLVMSNKSDQSHPTPIKRLRSEILSSRSPLQVLGTLKHTLDQICRQSALDQAASADPIASDDLIPLVIDLLVHSRIEDFPAILMYAEIFGTMVISYDEAFEFTLATFKGAVQYICEFNRNVVTSPKRESSHGKKSAPAVSNAPTKSGHELLSDYVKFYAVDQPFQYLTPLGSAPIDRYSLIAILT